MRRRGEFDGDAYVRRDVELSDVGGESECLCEL